MRRSVYDVCMAVMLVVALLACAPAKAVEEEAKQGEVRFAIGVTYASGIYDVNDFISDAFELAGYEVDDFVIPVGLTLSGGYRFSNGIEILADAGPVTLMYVDAIGGPAEDTYLYWDIPLGLTGGYAFLVDKPVSPYVRGGLRYHFAGGDFYDSSTPGLYVAGGVNFFSNKSVQMQLEIAYDTSEVTFVDDVAGLGFTDDIEPGGFMASIRVAF